MPSNERVLTCPRCGEGEMTHFCCANHQWTRVDYVKCEKCGFIEEKGDVVFWCKLKEKINESK